MALTLATPGKSALRVQLSALLSYYHTSFKKPVFSPDLPRHTKALFPSTKQLDEARATPGKLLNCFQVVIGVNSYFSVQPLNKYRKHINMRKQASLHFNPILFRHFFIYPYARL